MTRSLVVVLVVMTSAFSVRAQQPPETDRTAELADQLAGIRVALERLVELQEVDAAHARVESILGQMDVWLRRVEPIERKLAAAEEEMRAAENNLRQLERMKEQAEAERERNVERGLDDPDSEARLMLVDIRRSRFSYEEKSDAARLRVQQHESERDDMLRRIERLEDALLDLLDAAP